MNCIYETDIFREHFILLFHLFNLESIILDGVKQILGCSSKTCNEAVRGDMGLDTLQSRRDRAKFK